MAIPWQLRNAKRRNYKRPLFEELPSLDARWLARHQMIPRDFGRRVYDYSFIDPRFGGLILTPRVCEVIFPDGRQRLVSICWQHIQGMCVGTTRPLFVCPCCSNPCFKLYDLHGELYCKRCAAARGAIYLSQKQWSKGRPALQALRLRHFLNGWANQPPSKTPFMRKQTYRRLTNQLRQLEAHSPDQRRRKRKSKPLSHTAQRPVSMYRTQVTSIALA